MKIFQVFNQTYIYIYIYIELFILSLLERNFVYVQSKQICYDTFN